MVITGQSISSKQKQVFLQWIPSLVGVRCDQITDG